MAKIHFVPFTNNDKAVRWRNKLENDFLSGDGKSATEEIENVRRTKGARPDDEYYEELHKFKLCRQIKWLNFLLRETANLFDTHLANLSYDPGDVIAAALPEFFWIDINDNRKHNEDGTNGDAIVNYHKPLYKQCLETFLQGNNPLAELTSKYPNLIFFAGTAVWKEINNADHTNELMYNSMILYMNGRYAPSVIKHNVSTIDGFFRDDESTAKNKAGIDTGTAAPVTDFMGLRFAYDICLDFLCGSDGLGNDIPLSAELCRANNVNSVDVNVLIAAGMPVSDLSYLNNLSSDCLLRCDGYSNVNGQIFKNGVNMPLNALSDLISAGSVNIP